MESIKGSCCSHILPHLVFPLLFRISWVLLNSTPSQKTHPHWLLVLRFVESRKGSCCSHVLISCFLLFSEFVWINYCTPSPNPTVTMADTKPPQKLLAEIGKADVQKMKHVKTVEENSLPSAKGGTESSRLCTVTPGTSFPKTWHEFTLIDICLIYV